MSDYEETFIEEAPNEEILVKRLQSSGYDVYEVEKEDEPEL
jgi:hypothetical protein